MTFKHAGDAGDVLYSMPTMRALGGGTLLLHTARWTRDKMGDSKVASIRSLLETQPYIKEVRWLVNADNPVDVNLNDFRAAYFRDFRNHDFPKQRNLCEWILRTHGCNPDEQNKQWLHVEPIHVAPVIINRTGAGRQATHIYRNWKFPWRRIVETYNKVAFVGTQAEYEDFCLRFGMIPYYPTDTLLELAQVIAGADLFIGNQSCAYAIAEGLKKPAVLEVCPWLPNCLFNRSDVVHGWDANIDLPPIETRRVSSGGQSVSGESVPGSS